jgi:hypothetical protein
MSKTYDLAPPHVHATVRAMMEQFHGELAAYEVKVDLLYASTDDPEKPAVTLGGYPCYATVRITTAKERAKGHGDAEILIARDKYEEMSDEVRNALIDHELEHLQLKKMKGGDVKRDDHGRPVLKMKKHDHQFGWFNDVARRHGDYSIEMQQAKRLMNADGQLYFGFATVKERAA